MTKISDTTTLTGAGVDTAADFVPIVDMSETGIARNKKITPAQFLVNTGLVLVRANNLSDLTSAATSRTNLGVYSTAQVDSAIAAAVAGLLDFKGNTDCSANPNYPAASKGDSYLVSVAGKIGGASGKDVHVGDLYVASADNAGGDEAAVGTSWFVLEHNLAGVLPLTGGTLTGDLNVPDEAYDETAWNGSTEVPTKNAVRDKIEAMGGGAGRLVGIQTITATGAGTYTPTAGTTSIVIELVGGGGGGGGCASPTGSNCQAACGGGGGGYLIKRLTADFSGAAYVVGAKGTGGSAGANAGTNGANSTFTDTAGSPTVYTASGGTGGAAGVNITAPRLGALTGGGGATNGDIQSTGGPSQMSMALSTSSVLGGQGGISYRSPGASGGQTYAVNTSLAGFAAPGKGGGGGGGAACGTGAAVAGGNGSDGVLIIWEYS